MSTYESNLTGGERILAVQRPPHGGLNLIIRDQPTAAILGISLSATDARALRDELAELFPDPEPEPWTKGDTFTTTDFGPGGPTVYIRGDQFWRAYGPRASATWSATDADVNEWDLGNYRVLRRNGVDQ